MSSEESAEASRHEENLREHIRGAIRHYGDSAERRDDVDVEGVEDYRAWAAYIACDEANKHRSNPEVGRDG